MLNTEHCYEISPLFTTTINIDCRFHYRQYIDMRILHASLSQSFHYAAMSLRRFFSLWLLSLHTLPETYIEPRHFHTDYHIVAEILFETDERRHTYCLDICRLRHYIMLPSSSSRPPAATPAITPHYIHYADNIYIRAESRHYLPNINREDTSRIINEIVIDMLRYVAAIRFFALREI